MVDTFTRVLDGLDIVVDRPTEHLAGRVFHQRCVTPVYPHSAMELSHSTAPASLRIHYRPSIAILWCFLE